MTRAPICLEHSLDKCTRFTTTETRIVTESTGYVGKTNQDFEKAESFFEPAHFDALIFV